jgi:group I intron endonuclease
LLSGVYSIQNAVNGKEYVGSSVNLERRWLDHKSALRANRGHNAHLQSAWNEYGEDAFKFSILKTCTPDNIILLELEQKYIDKRSPEYNTRILVDRNTGTTKSPEAREKMRQAKLKNPTRYWLGKKRYPETIQKMSENSRRLSPPNKGVPATEDQRRIAGASNIGRPAHNKTPVPTKVAKWLRSNYIYHKRGNMQYLENRTGLTRAVIRRTLNEAA